MTYDIEPGAGPAHLDIGSNGGIDFDFPTIQGAVNAAATSGDTVLVDPGTYPELVTITKSVTLKGAQAGVAGWSHGGAESIVGTVNGAFDVLASNVVIDGFKITGVDGSVGYSSLGAGIHTWGMTSGYGFRNNIITKIEDKNRKVFTQLINTKKQMACDYTMLALYTRRLGPSK